MGQNIRDIVKESDDLHFIHITKPTKDRSTWTFEVKDSSSRLNGVSGRMCDYNFRTITLQRGTHFFLTYKFMFDDGSFEYFVDPKKSLHRSTVKKYVDGILNYLIYSNDISINKNDPSFKYTHSEMIRDGVFNYLDLCHHFQDYSSVGTGLTRDIRNLIVMDIDVNCEFPSNKKELERILGLFASCDFLPNFYIFNHESKHVQLQWLVKDCEYKSIIWKSVNDKIEHLEKTKHVPKELSVYDFNFIELNPSGIKYRKFTKALTQLSTKNKFGDTNYTFWKAKNFYTALLGEYGLELKMPKLVDGEITYLTQDEMMSIFETKESRRKYFESSPDMDEVYRKTESIMSEFTDAISEESIKKIKDDLDELFEDDSFLYDYTKDTCLAQSRNSFVLECTRNTTWELMRDNNYNSKSDVLKLTQKNFKSFKNKVKEVVKTKFNMEDEKYCGEWPGTTNKTKYTRMEFNNTFDRSFNFAVEHFSNLTYTNDDRDKSLEERVLKKQLRHVLIIYLKSCMNDGKIKNNQLLKKVNEVLTESGHVKISNTTLKRDLKEIGNYDFEDMKKVFVHVLNSINERSVDECVTDKKELNVRKKRMKRVNLVNIMDIKEFVHENIEKG